MNPLEKRVGGLTPADRRATSGEIRPNGVPTRRGPSSVIGVDRQEMASRARGPQAAGW